MANFQPEIGRLFRAHDKGEQKSAETSQVRALKVIDSVLASSDIKNAGREEWSAVRSLVAGYDKLDLYARHVLESFGLPFSAKFMKQYNAGMASVS